MRRFQNIRTKVSMLYAGLFSLALILTVLVAQTILSRTAEETVREELAASNSVYDRIWALRAEGLADAADLLAADFGFRAAVASSDVPTVTSALDNLRGRASADHALIVTLDGQVIGDAGDALKDALSALPFELQNGRGTGLVSAEGRPYQVIVAPVLAPVEVGWILFAVEVDKAELRSLEKLSAIPLQASILTKAPDANWTGDLATADLSPAAALAARSTKVGRPLVTEVSIGGEQSLALAKPLPTLGSSGSAVLLLRYPLGAAMAEYRLLQIGILLTGIAGLLVVLIGSHRLAGSIARPISALERAAKALEAGDHSRVEVEGHDEIARLGASFNAMADGIFERENRIAHMAFNDSLTGLPNRVFLREQLDAGLKRAVKNGGEVILFCLDLDGFKTVNDTLGHPVGDKLLREVGKLITDTAPDAFVARLGGDEFAIIMPDGSDADQARRLARSLIERMQEPIFIEDVQVLVGTSIGIAVAPGDGDSADLLLKNADLALYRAKADGRGLSRFFETSLDAEAQARRQMEIDLRAALTFGQFLLEYQPIYAGDGQRIACFEALLRWEHPISGRVSPAQFVPVAEECGLILRIGEWVLHQACMEAAKWDPSIRLAVNVSPRQFRNPGLSSVIMQAISRSGINPSRLEIEITESIFLDSGGDTLTTLHSLRAMGIRIALDDFGTGFSSLGYLKSFPFDKIKIDKSFVDEIATERSAEAIVRAIIDLAAALGMDTTAEGVETVAQLERLRANGCASIQGFLLGRPVSAAAAGDLSDANRGARRAA